MKVVDRAVYVGPNLHANFPVIRLRLDLGELEEYPSARLGTEFQQGLLDALPGLQEHGCSYGKPGGFVRRLTEDQGTWLGHILEHVALELQNVAGEQVSFGKTRSAGEVGVYDVVYQYRAERVGLEAGRLGLRLLASLIPADLRPGGLVPPEWQLDDDLERFIRFVQRKSLGPSTAALVRAAEARDIPWIRLNNHSLIQFGQGRYQKRIQATITGETSHIAVEIASDKDETNAILGELGLPVPMQRLVYDLEEAVEAAERIGYPVVVKPLNANHGRGVSIGLAAREDVERAYEQARKHSRDVLVEQFLAGLDHRILVVNGNVVAVSQRVPGLVKGDGKSTIADLIAAVNEDPRRGIGHEKVLTKLELDYQAERLLTQRGLDERSVPEVGEVVYLRSTGNLSTGGTAVDVTDVIHPDNRDMAVRTALAVGLDVCGVDFITEDITRSYKEARGGICEVNAAPGFRMHTSPSEGTPRDVAGPVIDMLFPAGLPSRIPVLAVTGTNGKTTTARMLAHIYKLAGRTVGLTTTEGVYVDGQITVEGDMTGPVAAGMVMRDPTVEVAVLETARGGLLRAGMGVERCDVGACLNVRSDHLGLRGVHDLDQLAAVKRIVIEATTGTAVLNADDPLCLKMAAYSEAERMCYVTMNPEHQLVREHIRSGGRAVALEAGINGHMITIYDHGSHVPLLWTHLIPATFEGRAVHNVQNAMFAAAMAYSADVKLEDIRHGLRTFVTSFFQAPGRMNVFSEHPFQVILDYAHNPHAMQSVCGTIERWEASGRRIVCLSAPGDRRDEDIREIAQAAAGVFDEYICRRDDNPRGRGPTEVPDLLARHLAEEGVDAERVHVIADEQEAVDGALAMAEAGDLVVVFADSLTRTWKQIVHFKPEEPGTPRATIADNRTAEPVRPALPRVDFDERLWVRDDRGVHIARDPED